MRFRGPRIPLQNGLEQSDGFVGLPALLQRYRAFEFSGDLSAGGEREEERNRQARTHQNSILVPNWMDLGWLHCSETNPNCPELQFVFGSQNTTRLVMLPP